MLRKRVLFIALQVTPPGFPAELLLMATAKEGALPPGNTIHVTNVQTYTPAEQSFINTLTPLGFLRKKMPFLSKAEEYFDSRVAL